MKKKILIAVTIFSVISGIAQEKWTVQRCVEYAAENNISIKQQALNVQYGENDLSQTKMQVLPNLNAGMSQNMNFGYSIDPGTNDFTSTNISSNNVNISSSVDIFKGFRQLNTIKQKQFDLNATLQDLEKLKNDISINIATAYLQILFNIELSAIAEKQLEITNQQIDKTQKLVDAGSLPKGNILEIQAQAANEELQLINAENNLKSAYLNLKQLLDLENGASFEIEIPDFSSFKMPERMLTIRELYDASLGLPQIQAAKYRLLSAEKGTSIAKSYMSPTLSLSASIGSMYSSARKNYDFTDGYMPGGYVEGTNEVVMLYNPTMTELDYPIFDQYSDNSSTSLGFRLSIPIFNNFQVKSAIDNSKIAVLNSRYQLQNTKNYLYKEIQQTHADALAALARFNGSKKALEAGSESFKYTQQKFDVGMLTSFDYNLAKNQLMKSESDLLQAKYQFIFTKSILDFYSGNPIKLN